MNLLWFLCIFPACIWLVSAYDSFKSKSFVAVYDLTNNNDIDIREYANTISRPDLFVASYTIFFNFTVIPASQPDDLVTVQLLDLDAPNFTQDFFADFFKRHNNATEHSGSLKALLRAVDMSSKDGIVSVITNTEKLKDTDLLHEIALKAAEKNIWIEYASYLKRPEEQQYIISKDSVESQLILAIKNFNKLEMDYHRLERSLKKFKKESATSTTPSPTPKIPQAAAFVFDVINPTQQDLDKISNIMAENYANRTTRGTSFSFPIIYSYSLDTPTLLDPSKDYTAGNFREFISQHRAAANSSTSLAAVVKALSYIAVDSYEYNNKIVYFTDNLPDDKYNLVLDVMNSLNHRENPVGFEYHTYGALSPPKKFRLYELLRVVPTYDERTFYYWRN